MHGQIPWTKQRFSNQPSQYENHWLQLFSSLRSNGNMKQHKSLSTFHQGNPHPHLKCIKNYFKIISLKYITGFQKGWLQAKITWKKMDMQLLVLKRTVYNNHRIINQGITQKFSILAKLHMSAEGTRNKCQRHEKKHSLGEHRVSEIPFSAFWWGLFHKTKWSKSAI